MAAPSRCSKPASTLTVIRDYLGHASIATTSRYLATNLEMKRSVSAAFWKRAGIAERQADPRGAHHRSWIAFLESL